MSFHHRAFQFEWESFFSELAPLLAQALTQDSVESLRLFVEGNLHHCSSPYDGEPLDADWLSSMEVGDIQEYADFALTKYYEPANDFGVGSVWQELTDSLVPRQRKALLGEPFGPASQLFDPGRQGSYFQTPLEIKQSIQSLANSGRTELAAFHKSLLSVASNGKGLYVTF